MDEDYVIQQLSQKKLKQVSFGSNGNGITYSNMTAIREAMEAAKIEGLPLQLVQIEAIKMEFCLSIYRAGLSSRR